MQHTIHGPKTDHTFSLAFEGPLYGPIGALLILGACQSKIKLKASLQQPRNSSIISSLRICPRRKLGQLGKLERFKKIFLIFTCCTFHRPNLITWTKLSRYYNVPFQVEFGNNFKLAKFSMLSSLYPGLALRNLVVNSITLILISFSIPDDAHKERHGNVWMTNHLRTTNAVHIKPYDKQTVCCKEIEGTCLCLKENISCHFFNNHSS